MLILIWTLVIQVCVANHTLLFNTRHDVRLTRGGGKTIQIVRNLQEVLALDYFYRDSTVCWVDSGMDEKIEKIACVGFNMTTGAATTHQQTLVKAGIGNPAGISCDWLTKKLYWTDRGDSDNDMLPKIEVISIESKVRKVLYWQELDQPRGIVVDPLEGLMFWTDWGESPKIQRASMNGDQASRQTIVTEGLYWPNGIDVDIHTKELFWVDGRERKLETSDYTGAKRRVLWEKTYIPYPISVSAAEDRVYWTDWKNLALYSLERNRKGAVPSLILEMSEPPIADVRVLDARHQPYSSTPCEQNNGGCSHLCLLSSSAERYSCACPIGIQLLSDNKTCAEAEKKFILLAQWTEISKISLDTPDLTKQEFPLKDIKDAMAIDYDPVEKFFYWTDTQLKNIRRAKIDGSRQENVVTQYVSAPEGIAIDWLARNLYWCDTEANRIEMYRLGTNYRKTVIFDDLERPRAMAVAPKYGYLFWSDWNERAPKIERSDLDGANRMMVVKNDIIWPNGLALDFETKKMYWADAKIDKIEVANFDGQERREIQAENLPHTFGLSLLGEHLYLTDIERRVVERVNKNTGKDRMTVLELSNLRGIKAVNAEADLGSNVCSANNGRCQQFCVQKPNDTSTPVCVCQVEYELQENGRDCALPETFLILHSSEGMRKVSVNDGRKNELLPIVGVKSVSAVDVNVADKRVYWAETIDRTRSISRSFLNGSRIEKIVELGVLSLESIAVDWLSLNLYWADVGTKRIEVVKLNGQFRRALFWKNLKEPRNLVCDPRLGLLFWSEWSDGQGSIMKANMDGSSKAAILKIEARINGLTIDYAQRVLYWTQYDKEVGSVEHCDLNGENRSRLIAARDFRPIAITQNRDHLFWTSWNNASVIQASKLNGQNQKVLYTQNEEISDLRVVDASKQTGWNPCTNVNGGNSCKYLCLVRPSASRLETESHCVCPSHHTMKHGICYPPDSYLLFSQRNAVYRLTTVANECPDMPLPATAFKTVRAIDYDPLAKNIYWIDGKTSTIKQTAENGTQTQIVIGQDDELDDDDVIGGGANAALYGKDRYVHVYDIAFEPYSKLLYWSCSVTETINVTRANVRAATFASIFASDNGDQKPRTLALFAERGLLFWVDVGVHPRIVQSRLNGETQTVIDTEKQLIDALTVDRKLNLLFFAYGDGKLFQYDLYEKRKQLVATTNAKIYSLAVMKSFLYWVDRAQQRIERVDMTQIRQGAAATTTVVEHSQTITDLVAATPVDEDVLMAHPCSVRNNFGNCSHLCLRSVENPNAAECACPLGLRLNEDRRTCSLQPPCGADHFACKSTASECIPKIWRCDGHEDCPDASDEEDCQQCGHDEYRCGPDACIKSSLVCDGEANCVNGTDETNCCGEEYQRAGAPYFACLVDGVLRCMSNQYLCDGWLNCTNGEDEMPEQCEALNRKNEAYMQDNSNIIVAVALIIFVSVGLTAIVFWYRRGGHKHEPTTHDKRTVVAMRPLAAYPTGCHVGSPGDSFTIVSRSLANGGGDSSESYDRNHLTGASSSASVNVPLNPPPSPTTTILQEELCCDRYLLPHPPTPCSTVVCDESDVTSSISSYRRAPECYGYRQHRHPHRRSPKRYRMATAASTTSSLKTDYYYDDDDDDDGAQTERSVEYEMPLPPPPTPLQNSSETPSPSSSMYFSRTQPQSPSPSPSPTMQPWKKLS